MVATRIILVVLISLGLVLPPAAGAVPAKMGVPSAPVTVMADDCPHHKAVTKQEIPCAANGQMGKCDSAFCALKCFKVVAVLPAPAVRRWEKHSVTTVDTPVELLPINWRPSPPPPRS